MNAILCVTAAVATLVGRDHVEAGAGESGDLVAPGVGELREAVAEHDRGPPPALVHRERERRLALARGGQARRQRDAARGRHPVRRFRGGAHRGRSLPWPRARRSRFPVPHFHSRLRPWTPAALPK